MSRPGKLWECWGQQLLCRVTIQHCPASRDEPRHFIATSLQRALSQPLQLSTFRRKSILNKMWARQQGCCGHRRSLSSAGSRLSQPGLHPRWSVSHPGDRQELSQTITALLLQACLHPWQGSGLCWSLAGACPCPCALRGCRGHGVGWGCLLGWKGWSCEKHLSLPRCCDKAPASLISLSALHRSLQEKRALPQRGFGHLGRVCASGGGGSSLGKGLLCPFCQHLSQPQ